MGETSWRRPPARWAEIFITALHRFSKELQHDNYSFKINGTKNVPRGQHTTFLSSCKNIITLSDAVFDIWLAI
jgi:hypothetical protein